MCRPGAKNPVGFLPSSGLQVDQQQKRQVNNYVCLNICTQLKHWRVRGSPWDVANRLHGQQYWAFFWRPAIRPSLEDRPTPTRPCPELRTRMAVWSGVISAPPRTRKVLRHLPTCDPPGFVPHACHPPPPSMLPPNPPYPWLSTPMHQQWLTRPPTTRNSSASEFFIRRLW